jgi:Domain of unknown function (DUF5655)
MAMVRMGRNATPAAPIAGRYNFLSAVRWPKSSACHHCKQWIEQGEEHDCWTTTEAALTQDLSEDLQDAWERLRETAVEFGDQRIYASGTAIMFSRKSCYFFVRPRRSHLQVCVFLGRAVRAPQIRRVERTSASKRVHIIHITHRDEVEAPITDWLREAYELPDKLAAPAAAGRAQSRRAPPRAKKRSRGRKKRSRRTSR